MGGGYDIFTGVFSVVAVVGAISIAVLLAINFCMIAPHKESDCKNEMIWVENITCYNNTDSHEYIVIGNDSAFVDFCMQGYDGNGYNSIAISGEEVSRYVGYVREVVAQKEGN